LPGRIIARKAHEERPPQSVCAQLAFLGVELDLDRNRAAKPDADVATASSRARVHVIHAREDVVAARAARSLL